MSVPRPAAPHAALPGCEQPRVGYVLKMYPRFSETFIVTEVLAHEAAGAALEIFSLRPPVDGRFHECLADVAAPVTYLPSAGLKATTLWDALRTLRAQRPVTADALDELLRADVDDAAQAIELARLVHERGITHLHAHFGSVAATVARLAGRVTGVPYSFTAHAKDIFHADVDQAALETKLADAATVVTVSDFNADHLRRRYGPAADGVVRVYNGLDLTAFPYHPPWNRPRTVVGVGRLVEKKGFADLVRGIALIAGEGVDVDCRIVGEGPERPALAALVDRFGLSDRVRLLGARPQRQVRELVAGASVLAAPCIVGADGNRDGLPTVLLEAMALGTPCVATDVTGIPEILHHGNTGLAVDQHDPTGLAAAIARLLGDAHLRVRLASAARRLVTREFDVTRQAARMRHACWSRRSTVPVTVAGADRLAAVTAGGVGGSGR